MEIHPRVNAIDVSGSGEIWVYLIRGQKTAIIDTGWPHSPEEHISPVLKKLDMTLTDIDFILNTHVHFDHTGGDAAIKSSSNAQICMHSAEANYLENPELVFEQYVPTVELVMGKAHIDKERKRFFEMVHPGPPAVVDRRLDDNDIIVLGEGLDLKVIHLPGHSPGSVGFYIEKEGILFAGDSIEGICTFDGGLPIIDDLAVYEKSLERVQQLSLKFMLLTHPLQSLTIPPSALLRDMEIKQFLEECLEFTQRLRVAAKGVAPYFSKKPFLELYDEVVLSFPEEVGFKSAKEVPQFFSATTLLNCIKQIKT